ncbi:hypothetical protein L202_00871 [Cryptococcus amylolentus CBS 6039]|uniref:Uncharacterized protein n=1 Tax=Cryptococcus amylolentus CBS 6039 TaxID=1295533 RepID=A0A1E3IBA2_9TREE|nr:hypothetical protein L202_00871 [Cryptococcus amylolentus CBS 6039]ODN85041.1 hypothetical protein L202_00871 [Cryptococcus amylolentus CBS 6039]
MFSMNPPNFSALHPVHTLILDELISSAPYSALRLCSPHHKGTIPELYRDTSSSPAVFRGLLLQVEYERPEEAFENTETIRINFKAVD